MDLDISGLDHDQSSPQPYQKGSVLSRNDRKWESLKQDIHKVYMSENNTLSQTMVRIEEGFGFKASPRKWKGKLKEWGFEKHLSEGDMKIVVAKMDKRRRETGKDTVVFHNGVQVPAEKLANFKRRKVVRESDPASPGAPTPGPISYCTPRIDMNSLIEVDGVAELDDHFSNFHFSAQGSPSRVEAVGMNVGESTSTNLRASQNDTRLIPVTAGFESDRVESSLEPVTEKRNVAPNEHEQEKESGLLSDASLQPEFVLIQETEGGEHTRSLVTSRASKANYSVTDDRNLVTGIPEMPSIELSIQATTLCALSQAIDECFREGFELDITVSQLLSMLTFVQGHPSDTTVLLSYWQMNPIAALAKSFIQFREDSNAVSLYKRVIIGSCLLSNENEYMKPTVSLKYLLLCSPRYLDHEQAILQTVIAGYFKFQLAAEIPSATASQRILGVIKRLRSIRNPAPSPLDEAVDQKLLSLAQTVNCEKFALQFRHELLSHALDLANYYSQREDFEAAEALFELRLGTRSWPITHGNASFLNRQISEAKQSYEQHQSRRCRCLYKSRVRPWSMADLPPLPPNRPSLWYEEEIDFIVTGLCQRLIRMAERFKKLRAKGDAHRTPLLQRKEIVTRTIVDTGTDTGFSNNSRPGRARRAALPTRREGLEVVNLDTETDTGFTTSSTRSYKYGVTMSDSDVPGIDLSRYLVR